MWEKVIKRLQATANKPNSHSIVINITLHLFEYLRSTTSLFILTYPLG